MDKKEKYRQYCKDNIVALYQNDWWLDAVCGNNWDVIFAEEKPWAYPIKKKYGLTLLQMPMLTLGLGGANKDQLASLPKFDLLDLYFLPGSENELSGLKGFKQAIRTTHRIFDLGNKENVFKNFSSPTRQQIRKAEKNVKVTETDNADLLFKMVSLTFKRQSKKAPYTLNYVKHICDACVNNDCCRILVAKDADGNVHGACLLAWDVQTAYYVMGGSDPKYKGSAAYSLLMWSAIQEAAKHSKQFDFCGSSIPSIAKFFKGFGAKPLPYLHLKKVNSKALKLFLTLREK